MATRPFAEYDTLSRSDSTPSRRDSRGARCPSSSSSTLSANSIQLPLTPPPSLPASSPGSPEYRLRELQDTLEAYPQHRPKGRSASFEIMTPGLSACIAPGVKPNSRRPKKTDPDPIDHVELSVLPEGYGDIEAEPILPKTTVSFPSVFSDEDSTDETRPRGDSIKHKPMKTPRRRVVSQETVITTTSSTRKYEKRKIRYSASNLDEMDNKLLQETRCCRETSPMPRDKSRSSSLSWREDASHPLTRATSPPSRSPRLSQQRQRPAASPRRAGSLPRPRYSCQSSSASVRLDQSQSRRRRSSPVPACPAPPNALVPRSLYHSDSYPSSLKPSSFALAEDYPLYRAQTFTDSSIPMFRPVVNLFTFLLVSSFCCLTVSAVLVTSFSLTFYDDCSRKLGGLNRSLKTGRRSIEGGLGGVRQGMGRVLGSAKGAIESAVRAAEIINSTNGEDQVHHQSGSNAMPTVTGSANQGAIDVDEVERKTCRGEHGNTRQSSKSRTSGGTPRARSRPSPFRRSLNPFTAFVTSQTDPTAPDQASTEFGRSGWATDEDALPYDVPHPTPRTSRPVSPHRSPRSRQTSASDQRTQSSHLHTPSSLPPRPHLAILLPSLLLAVVLTLAKLGFSFWKASQERQAQQARKRAQDEHEYSEDASHRRSKAR